MFSLHNLPFFWLVDQSQERKDTAVDGELLLPSFRSTECKLKLMKCSKLGYRGKQEMSQHHFKNTRLVNNSLKYISFLQHTKSNLWFWHACECNWVLDFWLSSSAGTAVEE